MALRYRDVAAISLQVLFFILLLLDQLQLVSTKKEDKSATYSVPVPPPTLEDNQTLYFSSNGWKYGIHTYVGGMYGGNMKVKDHGDSRNMSVVNLECFFATGGQVIIKTDHLKTRSMAFDPIGNQVLFHIYDKRRLSAYLFPRCHFGDMCNYKEIKKNERYQARTLFSYSVTMDRSATCETEIQPFGMYDYDVYFIAKRHIKETLRVELRKLVGCEYEQFHSQNPFQIDRCSLHIITLEETTPDRCDYVKLTNNILVVKKDGRKHYLVQIFNRTQSSFEVVLVVGTKDSKNGVPVRHLYREPLPYNYHEFTDEGRHLGGISYKFGKLCWSAVTRILCADWDIEGGLQNIESVLHPWQAADSICNVGKQLFIYGLLWVVKFFLSAMGGGG